MTVFASAAPIIRHAAAAFRPPRRVSVSQGAADSLVIRQPGGYSGPWSPTETPYMVEPMDMLASRKHEAVCFVGPARTGKCLDIDTPIPTPTGWKRMGELQAGDLVYGPDGKPTKVLEAYAVKHGLPCYRVEFSDGSHLIADSEHLWGVERFYWRAPNWRFEIKSTAEIAAETVYSERNNGRKRFRYRVRNTAPIECPDADLPLDPYLLGVWLGDGSATQAAISAHREDAEHYVQRFEAAGHRAVVKADKGNTVWIAVDLRERLTTHCQRGHLFAEAGKAGNGACMECLRQGHHRRKYGKEMAPLTMFAGSFSSKLHALGVHGNKHIPAAYLRASVAQRVALLRGLMDTDGCHNKNAGNVEFVSVLPGLAAGFCELARSLGFKPVQKEKKTSWSYGGERKVGKAYRVTFPIDGSINPFDLNRKAEGVRFAGVDVGFRQIVSVTPVDTRPVRCILVDNESHLFLAGAGMVPTHNTLGLLDGWLARNVTCDPGDMLITQMSQEKAREYSKTRVDRAIRHSPKLAELMSQRGHDDNTHDKLFRHGMWVKIGWPSATQLSSSDYRYVALTDYDRMPDNIDGEGSAYALGLKRTQTFLSRGMCMVESSPGRDYSDPYWKPQTPHEAPPATGIVGIYNRSDRRRWYWQCPDCSEFFEASPGIGLFSTLPTEAELLEEVRSANLVSLADKHAIVVCPHCASLIEQRHKPHLNNPAKALWLADGQTVTRDREVIGEAPRSSIAGYWLGGVAAAYQKWDSILLRYLQGLREYVLSGSDLTLKATINTDQGAPYIPRHLLADKEAGLEDRIEDLPRFHVPDQARFLIATADVQGGTNGRFVCEVRAFGEYLESWLVDRFSLTTTERSGIAAQVDPAGYPEDWDLLTQKLVQATYKTSDGRELRVLRTAVDTGGEAGTTPNAYAWFRRLRKLNLSARVMLIKGADRSNDGKPVVKGTARTNEGRAMPDMPIWLVATDYFKDLVAGSLRRKVPGPGYFHAPKWLHASYFEELRAEVRDAKGKWKKVRTRNEALDLWVYALAVCEALGYGPKGRLSWDNPPPWARRLDAENSELITSEERRAEHKATQRSQPAARHDHDDWNFDRRS
jgi:phage terminase large subunit GpA-like protein